MTGAGPIHLAVLLQDLEFGGTQRYAIQLLGHIDRNSFAPELWVLRGGDHLLAEARATGVSVVHLSRGRKVGALALIRLARRLRAHRPDLLYTLTVVPNIWGRLFAGLMGIPVVSGYRNLQPRQNERLLNRFSTRIVANAEALACELTARHGVAKGRIAVVPNAVDTNRFAPDPGARAPEPLVVCIARQAPQKDIPTLLAAFELVRVALPEARLEIVGDGALRFEAPVNVQFLPGVRDVRPYLRRAWLLALSSAVDEGMPNAALEALACGTPVAATAVGGVPECVIDGETGFLAPPRDAEALSRAMLSILRDPGLRDRLGRAGRERMLVHHAIAPLVRRTEAVLAEAAGDHVSSA